MYWFLELLDELGIDRQVGHPAEIRAAEPRKQKHDRRDALLLLRLQIENRFPSIWVPSRELRDLHVLLGTVISGFACGPGYKMHCKLSP